MEWCLDNLVIDNIDLPSILTSYQYEYIHSYGKSLRRLSRNCSPDQNTSWKSSKSPWTKLSENDFRHRRRYHHHWEGASSSSPTSSQMYTLHGQIAQSSIRPLSMDVFVCRWTFTTRSTSDGSKIVLSYNHDLIYGLFRHQGQPR